MQPRMRDGAPVWCKAAKNDRTRLQIPQSKCLNIMPNKTWCHSTNLLHFLRNIQNIENLAKKKLLEFLQRNRIIRKSANKNRK